MTNCECCGIQTDKSNQRMVIKVVGFVNLENPQVMELFDNRANVNGQIVQYSYRTEILFNHHGDFGVMTNQVGHHIVCSNECIEKLLMNRGVHVNDNYVNQPMSYMDDGIVAIQIIPEPSNMFPSVKCSQCGTNHPSSDKKYIACDILDKKITSGNMDDARELSQTYTAVFTDTKAGEHGKGTLYAYRFNMNSAPKRLDFCSNECAYENSLLTNRVYIYFDLLNHGRSNGVFREMIDINAKLGNWSSRGIAGG
jgi:hypothetical protein